MEGDRQIRRKYRACAGAAFYEIRCFLRSQIGIAFTPSATPRSSSSLEAYRLNDVHSIGFSILSHV